MIWLFFAVALVAPVVLILSRREDEVAFDPLSHFKAQLAEIEEDESRGIIDSASARAAKLEVERRLLRSTAVSDQSNTETTGDKRPIGLAVVLVVGSAAIYALLGRPDLPASPGFVVSERDKPIQEGGKTYGEAIAAVQVHLAQNPDDVEGLEVLAKAARSVRDFSVSANAFARLAELDPENAGWRLQQFEAMMAMSGGRISPATRLVLADFIRMEPSHPAGQYYLGQVRLENGDEEGAKSVWLALAARSAPNAPWMPRLRAQLATLGAGLPTVSQEQMNAVSAMSEEERAAFVKSMMDRLAARLEQAPDDPEGWMMLARAHLTTGDKLAAIAALERGLAVVSDSGKAPLATLLDNLRNDPDL